MSRPLNPVRAEALRLAVQLCGHGHWENIASRADTTLVVADLYVAWLGELARREVRAEAPTIGGAPASEVVSEVEAVVPPIWPEDREGLFYVNRQDRSATLAGKTASAVAADLEAIPLGELPRERLDQHIARVSADVAVARPCREDGPTLHGQVPGPEQAGELREAGLESHRGQSDE